VGKAFLYTDANGHYSESLDHSQGHVNNDTDMKITVELQQALDEGKDLVLCPGMYFLTQPLLVRKVNQVILGLGMATLVAPHDGSPCIRVMANTAGVRIAGLMLEASVQNAATSDNNNSDGTKSLLDFGEPETNGKKDSGDPANPGLIADLYSRVGGSNLNRSVTTDVMVRIFSGHVICDNLWLWRADHVKLDNTRIPPEEPNDPPLDYHQVRMGECMVDNAIWVYGDNVSIYGLACEHTIEDQIIWKGEHGSVTFIQMELPYDILDTEYPHTGYHVHEDVDHHTGRGFGIYTNFTQAPVFADCGLQFPNKATVKIQNPMVLDLDSKGGFKNVLRQGGVAFGEFQSPAVKMSHGWKKPGFGP